MSGDSSVAYTPNDRYSYSDEKQARTNNWRRVTVLTAAVAFMGLAIIAPKTPVARKASAATLCVNPGGTGGCFSSIQAAVNAASPGDTINVAAGTYTEMVMVNKTLSLRGAQAGVDARTRSAPESILNHPDGSIQIEADNVVIDGFTVQGATNDPNAVISALGAAIWTNPGFSGTQGGHQILNNIVKDSIAGLYLNNTGTLQAKVQFNLFQNNNATGPASGDAMFSDLVISNAVIDSNKFTGHTDAAVFFLPASGTSLGTNITISNNESSANGRAFAFGFISSVMITGNVSTGSTFAASADIRIFGGVNTLSIRENALSGGAGAAIRLDDSSGTNPSSNITMFCNSIQGYAGAGLELVAGGYTGTLDAKNNWWGSATGPTIASNPGGTGQAIIDPGNQVVFVPFLTSNVDNDPIAPGFQCACSVGDTQPPTITCPANVSAVGPVVTFPPPTVTDNCPGATATCVPPSGSSFAAGTTTVTCTATDVAGNMATCSFTVTVTPVVFDVCLQDDTNPTTVLLFSSTTGDYRFCCGGNTFTGKGTVKKLGSTVTLTHAPVDRRVQATVDQALKRGSALFQSPPGVTRCTITDRNTMDDTCVCN